MVHSLKKHLESENSWTWKAQKIQEGSALSVQEILNWMSPTEQFIGNRFLGIIWGLKEEERNAYIVSITHSETMKPLMWQMLASFQVDERVSVSRVITYIEAHLS